MDSKCASVVYKTTLCVDVRLSLLHINFFKHRNTTFNDKFLALLEIFKKVLFVLRISILIRLIFFLEYVKVRQIFASKFFKLHFNIAAFEEWRNFPEICYLTFCIKKLPFLLRFNVDVVLFVVCSTCVFSKTSLRNFVYHSISWKQIGSPSNSIDFIQKLYPYWVQIQWRVYIWAIVMA